MGNRAQTYDRIQSGVYADLRAGMAIILDMDGVIIDSNPVHRSAWSIYNRRFGIETDEAMQQRMYGKRNDEIVRDFLGANLTADQVREHGAAKERLYRELMSDAMPEARRAGCFRHRLLVGPSIAVRGSRGRPEAQPHWSLGGS